MNCRSLFFSSLALLLSTSLFAQDQLGLKLDRYAGINSAHLNPAMTAVSPLKWNVNVASGGVFFDNNYGFLNNTSLISLLKRNDYDFIQKKDLIDEAPATEMLVVDYYTKRNKKFGSALGVIYGPAAMIKLDDRTSIGLFANFKFATGITNLPEPLTYDVYYNRSFDESFRNTPSMVSGASWLEIGFNFGKANKHDNGTWALGINAKLLAGYDAFYLKANQAFNLTKLPGDTLVFDNSYFEGGFTKSYSKQNGYAGNINGYGASTDIGFVYTIDGEDDVPKWTVGISMLDIGFIKYNSNTEQHRVDRLDAFKLPPNLTGADNLSELAREISLHSLDSEGSSFNGKSLNMGMPTALSLQMDYNVMPLVFLSGTLIQRMPMSRVTLKRDNILALTPRYETKYLSLSVPFVLHNYQKLRYGLAARLGWLTLGTENLGSIVDNKDFSGTDLYAGIIINPVDIKNTFGRYRPKRKKNRPKCYKF